MPLFILLLIGSLTSSFFSPPLENFEEDRSSLLASNLLLWKQICTSWAYREKSDDVLRMRNVMEAACMHRENALNQGEENMLSFIQPQHCFPALTFSPHTLPLFEVTGRVEDNVLLVCTEKSACPYVNMNRVYREAAKRSRHARSLMEREMDPCEAVCFRILLREDNA